MSVPIRAVHGREYQLLTAAHRARKRGREREAIRHYKRILIEYPQNISVTMRVAPMLACHGESFEAWQLYRRAAHEYARQRQYNECLGVYREACRFVPHEFEAWRLCAELQTRLGQPEGAFETLVEGRMHFGAPHSRGQAIALLARAREIEPWDDTLLLDLAQLYVGDDQPDMALDLLSMLSCRVEGALLRRVRWMQFRTTLAPRYLFLWIQALGSRSTDEPSLSPAPLPQIEIEAEEQPALREVGA